MFRAGTVVHLTPKAFDLLLKLLAERPRAVAKAELQDHLWPDAFVSEANLPMLVAEIRNALGDSPSTPLFVRTVPRFGYAFSGQATDIPHQEPVAAGALGAWLLIGRERVALEQGVNLLGRDPACRGWINAPGVSRRHAQIVLAGDAAELQDLDSKNGTYLNGTRVTGPVALTDRAEIRIGSFPLTFRTASPTSTTETQWSTGMGAGHPRQER